MSVLKVLQFTPTLVLMATAALHTIPVKELPAKAMPVIRSEEAPARSRIRGIVWYESVDDALKIAQREGKLVFWYHIAGRLDGRS